MAFFIQDPKYPTTPSLHEALLDACQNAISGGGAFAFVTKEGAELFLEDDIFKVFVNTHPFDLIVGVDEITNVRALNALTAMSQDLEGLTVKVFFHKISKTIFHPKFCWFRYKSGGVLITGSGNLTLKGLRGNWEAFTVTQLNKAEIDEIEQIWTEWTENHADLLKPADDAEVLARAAKNVRRIVRVGTVEVEIQPGTEQPEVEVIEGVEVVEIDEADEVASGVPEESDEVLVAEIPRGGESKSRWKQANFDLDSFRNFFGASDTETQRILLQHVLSDGSLGKIESRPSVSVKSRNFRFELEAAAGLDYPDEGRPIGVFVRIAPRSFRYRLLMPGDEGYDEVDGFLEENWNGRADRMRRVRTNTARLQQDWPDSPLWSVD